MNYQEALEYINDKNKLGSKLGLDSIGKLLDLLGNPEKNLKYIHVGGTNGKGSTSSYISNILETGGYKVGLFTSPYIEKINESIRINNLDIPDEVFGRLTKIIKDKIDIMVRKGLDHPTSFEIITVMGFMYFYEEKVDFCILEVGLGGRFDATNIIPTPLATVFTTIDYDHIDILGSTLREIAYQKAGIIKENSIVISYPQEKEALEIIMQVSREKKSELHICPMENISIKELVSHGGSFDFHYGDFHMEDIKISMVGEYQVYNATLAMMVILILKEKGLVELSPEHIREGINNTRWAGRLEIIGSDPTFLIDGAHNLQGVSQLKKALSLFEYNRLILGLGILRDKDISHMVRELGPMADKIVVTEPNMVRKLDGEILGREISKYNENVIIEKDIKRAIEKTFELAEKDDLIVFCGSLYLIGEVRKIIKLL